MATATADRILAEVRLAWRPPEKLTLSEWSDKHAYLSAESSAQEGRWRTLPYQKGMLDAMTDPECTVIVVKKSARVGYTKCINNLVGYHIHHDPASIMVVQPTIEDAQGYSKEEIAPMIRDTPVLTDLVADAKSKDSNNTILSKSFPGGTLSLVGANSPRGFRRVSRRIVLFDEISGYPPSAGSEGDQIKLGIRRSEYYWNRKIVMGSTPTNEGSCRVSSEFEKTDKRRFFVPCPHCGGYQYLKWGHMRWTPGQPNTAHYECEHCRAAILPEQKYAMMERGEWRPTATSTEPGLIGFHIWAAYSYSPNATWAQLVAEYEESKNDPNKLKTFTNTVLGEAYADSGVRADEHVLMARARAETYSEAIAASATLPDGVLVITAGADNQPDRIELEVVGWGLGEESWSLDYRVFWGDPNSPLVWQQVDAYLASAEFVHPTGVVLRPARVFLDTAGSNTKAVYDYVRDREHIGVYGIKGRGGDGIPAVGAPTKSNIGKIPLFPIGTFTVKDTVQGRLAVAEPGPGYCHFRKDYREEFFKGITAEEVRTTTNKKGFTVREWYKVYERNEPWDCRVYATAALSSLNVNLSHLHEIMNGTWQQPEIGRKVRGEIENAG